MRTRKRLKITYVGGGSRFVVTLLHGLAAQAEALKALGAGVDLALLDPDLGRAQVMAEYAEITARQTGLEIRPLVTDDRRRALKASDWVLFSIGLWGEVRAIHDRYKDRIARLDSETGPALAIEAAVYWPHVAAVAEAMRAACPDALFTTLVNPTDAVAAAVSRRFGLRAVGVCVEVPQLVGWLARQMRVPYEDIRIQYLGLNHLGWVSRFTVRGRRGAPLLAEALRERMAGDLWNPLNDQWVQTLEATGLMRTSPYHPWPYLLEWTEARQRRRRRCQEMRGPDRKDDLLRQALAEGRMIEEDDPLRQPLICYLYQYPETRHTLGAMAVGLAGGSAGPVPIQARNGRANPVLPPGAWLEAPTRIERRRVRPQPVPRLPSWALAQLRALAEQRMLLARWLATGEPRRLTEALMLWPSVASTDVLMELIRDLPGYAQRPI